MDSTDVLIVGAGPVGLAMGCELRRHGVACRLIEMASGPSPWSKAAALQARTLEIFESMGVLPQMKPKGRPFYGMNVYDGALRVAHLDIDIAGTDYGYVLGISQRDTEFALAGHFERLGGRIERNVKLDHIVQDDDGVDAELSGGDGTKESIRVPWLIGCDGARSTVREELGLPFEGTGLEERWIQADVRVKFPFHVPDDEALVFVSQYGVAAFLPLLPEARYRLVLSDPSGAVTGASPSLADVQALSELCCPAGTELRDPAWIIGFCAQSHIASSFRSGRVFLAGDAAHVHSPAGAQGLNLGVADAFNLAWKLALVIRGAAYPSLLESYHAERYPVANTIVRSTELATRGMFQVLSLRSPLAQALRNELVAFLVSQPAFHEKALQAMGGLTVDYHRSPIVGEHQVALWRAGLRKSNSTEKPTISDWIDFGQGPRPGARVSPVTLSPPFEGKGTLSELLRGTEHALLLFDGAAPTEAGYRTFARIYRKAHDRFGRYLRTYIITPQKKRPAALSDFEGHVLLDPDAILHRRFGAGSECLYLVRPDGYVGYRSQPADEDKLFDYLNLIFA